MLILKIIFKNKKYYFNTFPSKNTLKKPLLYYFDSRWISDAIRSILFIIYCNFFKIYIIISSIK